jgi:hypothetical protein
MNIVSSDWLLVFQATTILYFKQFYYKCSMMEHGLKHIMWILQRPISDIGYKHINQETTMLFYCSHVM